MGPQSRNLWPQILCLLIPQVWEEKDLAFDMRLNLDPSDRKKQKVKLVEY